MTEWLIRRFVPDSGQIYNPAVRARYGVLAGVVGIVINLLLSGGKLAVGLAAASVSVLGDALNNLTDAASSVATLVGFRLAALKEDDNHPLGHGRIEYLAGLLVSLVILLVGIELGQSSLRKIFHPEEVRFSVLTVVILLAAIAAKLWMNAFHRCLGEKLHSAAMKAAAADALSDTAATAAVLAGILIQRFFHVNVDGWAGLLVAVLILRAGWQSAKETINPLVGARPDPELIRSIRETVLSHAQIIGIHDLMVHDYGPGHTLMTFHAEVPLNMDIMEAHDTIDHVEREIRKKYGIETTIHMDPIDTEDETAIHVSRQIGELARIIDPNMTIHDFRMTRGPMYSNLIFDVVVPHSCSLSDQEIRERIQRAARALDPSYRVVLQVDHTDLAADCAAAYPSAGRKE